MNLLKFQVAYFNDKAVCISGLEFTFEDNECLEDITAKSHPKPKYKILHKFKVRMSNKRMGHPFATVFVHSAFIWRIPEREFPS